MVALEKKTGRRVWTAGQAAHDRSGTKAQGVWFAGVPRVFRNRLFTVMEWNGEVRLACFAAHTGEMLWSTTLAWPAQTIDKDPIRRLWSATPVVSQGIVFCPTMTGWMTCVDEVTRSVIWSSSVRGTQIRQRMPAGRGQPTELTAPTPLRERWAVSKVVLASDRLLVLPHEVHEMVVLDALTGQQKSRVPVGSSTVLLHLGESSIVWCEQSRLTCRNWATGQKIWSRELSDSEGRPMGEAVRQDDTLIVPMTTGAIIRIDLASGVTTETVSDLLPSAGWGQLAQTTGPPGREDLLYMTPNRLIRLSRDRPESQPGNPMELASGLMATEKWQAALDLAAQVSEDAPESQEAKAICFRCRIRLAAEDPDTHLPRLKQMMESPEERIQVRVLEIELLLANQNSQAAAGYLADTLQLSDSLLRLPAFTSRARHDSTADQRDHAPRPERSLQTWAASTLSDLLDSVPNTDAVLERLDGVSNAALLSLNHRVLLPTIHDRISASTSHEAAMQLLRHAVSVKTRSSADETADFSREVELFCELVTRVRNGADTPVRAAAALLLNVTALEMPTGFLNAVQTSPLFRDRVLRSEDALTREFRTQLTEQFSGWSADSYRTIPVARLRSFAQPTKSLARAETDDRFLRCYRWTASGGTYGRLQAHDVVQGNHQRWSIPGSYQLYGSYSQQQDILLRVGSVLLLRSNRGLTAISVLDQKVLWSRTFASTVITSASVLTGNFDRFVLQKTRLPSYQLSSAFQIVGSGHGWLALWHASQLSIIDVYSGRTIWSIQRARNVTNIVASGSVVIMMSGRRRVAGFDTRHGRHISLTEKTDRSFIPIRNVEDRFVCWQDATNDRPAHLQWVDPLTNDVIDKVALTNMQNLHFVDDRTLAGINRHGQIQIVDLKSGTSRKFSFLAEDQTSAGSATQESDTGHDPADLPLGHPARIQVSSDGLNFYVCNRKSKSAAVLRSPSNRHLTIFEGDLSAVDRQSGQLSWHLKNTGPLMATTDQPELPILLLIEASSTGAAGQTTGRRTFRGISKLTGKRLFRQSIPHLSDFRSLSITSPARNTLDIGVQGIRVRIEANPLPDTSE